MALLVGAWLNGEVVTARAVQGTALILAGLAFYQWGATLGVRIRTALMVRAGGAGE